MKVCLHAKCRKTVTDDLVACRPHWMQLPDEIRKGLVRAKATTKNQGRGLIEIPENEPLMKVVTGQAHDFWEKNNAAT